jgi:hypothetical protein
MNNDEFFLILYTYYLCLVCIVIFFDFCDTYITNVLRDPPDTRLACVNSRGKKA